MVQLRLPAGATPASPTDGSSPYSSSNADSNVFHSNSSAKDIFARTGDHTSYASCNGAPSTRAQIDDAVNVLGVYSLAVSFGCGALFFTSIPVFYGYGRPKYRITSVA